MFAVLLAFVLVLTISSNPDVDRTHSIAAEVSSSGTSCREDATFQMDQSAGEAFIQTSKNTLSFADLHGQFQPSGPLSKLSEQAPEKKPFQMNKNFAAIAAISGIIVLVGLLLFCAWHFRVIALAANMTMQLRREDQEAGTASQDSQGTDSEGALHHCSSVRLLGPRPSVHVGPPLDANAEGEGESEDTGGMSDSTDEAMEENDEERADLWEYLEESNSSFKLLARILGALAQIWGMLGLLYWSLLAHGDELMECYGSAHGPVVTHLCTFTGACLRGFPVLACNVCLVLMIRILIQNRIYYSMLSLGHVLHFAEIRILRGPVPWLLLLSMLLGGSHPLLTLVFSTQPVDWQNYASLLRRFVIPGGVFISLAWKFTDIEGTLVPLNRLVDRDCSKFGRFFPRIAKLQALDELILADWSRRRDIIGDTWDAVGHRPTLGDVFQHVLDTYEKAVKRYHKRGKEVHYNWTFFKALWPSALLIDARLDWHEKKTRDWLIVLASIFLLCILMLFLSLCFFVAAVRRNLEIRDHVRSSSPSRGPVTEIWLAISVLVVHFAAVLFFLDRTLRGMFYFAIKSSEIEASRSLSLG